MSRQLEAELERQSRKRHEQTVQAVYGGLSDAVARAGGVLHGLTFKIRPGDCLLVIKADLPGGAMVAFVGADDVAGCFRKGQRDGQRDELTWRPDKWANR